MKKRSIWDNSLKNGNLGESFVRWYCQESYIEYKKATYEENVIDGVDAWIGGIPTDIKNTPKIFLGKYSLKQNKFYARHPFRDNTKAKQYCILDIDEEKKLFQVKNLVEISAYLSVIYFTDPSALQTAKDLLLKYNNKSYKELGFKSSDQLMLKLKLQLQTLLRDRIYCGYDSYADSQKGNYDELAISIVTYDDRKR